MYIFLTLFFISLASIIFMIGRKLALVKSGQVVPPEHSHVFVPDLQKIKQATGESAKKYGYLALVATFRFYIKTSDLLKNKYEELKIKIKNASNRRKNGGKEVMIPEQETNKFLKLISDYKHKIREIKHKIREEEKNS